MKKLLYIFSYTLYIFFVLGLVFHTSAHPQIFNRYTFNYLIVLVSLILFFPVFLFLLYFIGKQSSFKIKKRKFIVGSIKKMTIFIVLFCLIIVLPTELFLRYKYRNYESNTYEYTIDNFHPFLQFQLANNYATPINSYGFRGEEIQKKKPKGTYRIFVLGGSTVLNRGTYFEKSAVRLLGKALRKRYPNKKIEVVNAGVDAYTSEHSLIQYFFKIKDFSPDMIIMWHGMNDFIYSCSSHERSHGVFQSDYSNMLSADASMVFDHFKPQPLISFKFLTYDFFVKFLSDNWYSDLKNFNKKNHPFEGFYTKKTKDKQYDMKEYPSLQSYRRNMQSLIDATKTDGVKLILGNQPSLYDESLNTNELRALFFSSLHCSRQDGKYPSLLSMIKAMRVFNNATKEEAEENNIPFIDLESQVPKNLEYFTDDAHYTEKGNARVAETLYKFIVSKDLLSQEWASK